MKKLFSSFVAAGTVASFAACGKKDKAKSTTTKNTKTENKQGGASAPSKTVVRGKKAKGKFKIGYVSSNFDYAWNLRNTVKLYTQDVTAKSDTGKEYFELPSGLFLESSTKYNSIVHEYSGNIIPLHLLKAFLLRKAILLDSDEEDGSTHTSMYDYDDKKEFEDRDISYDMTALNALLINNHKNPNEKPLPPYLLSGNYLDTTTTMIDDKGMQVRDIQHVNDAIFGITGGTRDTIATIEEFEDMFTMEIVWKIYKALEGKTEPTALDLQKAFKAAGLKVASVDFDDITPNSDNIDDLNTVYFNAGRSDAKIPIQKIDNKNAYSYNKFTFFPRQRKVIETLKNAINKLEHKNQRTRSEQQDLDFLKKSKKVAETWLKQSESIIQNSKTTPLYKDLTKINNEFLSSNMAPKKMLSDKTKLASKKPRCTIYSCYWWKRKFIRCLQKCCREKRI